MPKRNLPAPDFPRYRAVSRQVREIFKRPTDLIEPLSLDKAYLDVSENKTGRPTATQVAHNSRTDPFRTELYGKQMDTYYIRRVCLRRILRSASRYVGFC